MIEEINPNRCRNIRQNTRQLNGLLQQAAKDIADGQREVINIRNTLTGLRSELEAAKAREVAAQGVGALPGGPATGAASTLLGIEAAMAIARLEPQIDRLETDLKNANEKIKLDRGRQNDFQSSLMDLSREANQLNCVI